MESFNYKRWPLSFYLKLRANMRLPLFVKLAKRPAVVERLLEIESRRKGRLIQYFAVRAALHMLSHPAFGIARGFRLYPFIGGD